MTKKKAVKKPASKSKQQEHYEKGVEDALAKIREANKQRQGEDYGRSDD